MLSSARVTPTLPTQNIEVTHGTQVATTRSVSSDLAKQKISVSDPSSNEEHFADRHLFITDLSLVIYKAHLGILVWIDTQLIKFLGSV